MKKIIMTILGCFTLLSAAGPKAFAVWPPETSLQDETATTPRQQIPVTERLEQDIRKLDEALKDLKQDQQDLKKKQEENNGRDLH